MIHRLQRLREENGNAAGDVRHLDALNLVQNSQVAIPDSTKEEKAIATVTILYGDSRWEGSAGTLFLYTGKPVITPWHPLSSAGRLSTNQQNRSPRTSFIRRIGAISGSGE